MGLIGSSHLGRSETCGVHAAVARGPFPQELNKQALFRARLDMHAGEIKAVKEVDSVKAELPLVVYQDEAPDIYKMADDDAVEIGPFVVRFRPTPLTCSCSHPPKLL